MSWSCDVCKSLHEGNACFVSCSCGWFIIQWQWYLAWYNNWLLHGWYLQCNNELFVVHQLIIWPYRGQQNVNALVFIIFYPWSWLLSVLYTWLETCLSLFEHIQCCLSCCCYWFSCEYCFGSVKCLGDFICWSDHWLQDVFVFEINAVWNLLCLCFLDKNVLSAVMLNGVT